MAGALNFLLTGCLLQGALCQVFEVIAPKSIEALSGSCVTIPCSFNIEKKYKKYLDNTCRAIWISGSVVFDSADQTRNIELTGILKDKDCTTTLNNIVSETSKEYWFRLECEKVQYSFSKATDMVNILFTADPPSPTLTPSKLAVKEGTTVSLKCSAPAPCLSHPPNLTWTPGLGDSQETLQETWDKTKVKTSVLNFTASHLHHGKTISCTATYNRQDGSTVSSVSRSLTLNISFTPQILSTSVCTKTAAPLNCSCETKGNPPPILQWHSDELSLNHLDNFALNKEHMNDTGLRSFITVSLPQERGFFTLLCRSSNSLGSVTQRFYVSNLGCLNSAEECSGEKMLPVFIITVVVLTAALVCALLFATRGQITGCCNPKNNHCTGDTSTGHGLTSENGNEVSLTSEEDIYVNTNMMRKLDKPNTHLGHQQAARSEKNEEGSDVTYTSVIWKGKKKKGAREQFEDRNPASGSYLEEERCMTRGMCRTFVSNTLEMGSLYDNVVTSKEGRKAACSEYTQVNIRDKNIMVK
ncbi:sialic acid-binding Ig-like lectin 14 isoform X2 [Lates calcarifer]|uniref:Sialic acid-binding Ig-like lectin 14 isoform X2 n=1 Tax=Lates calcarifer TaxID=8187 RepID=A0AAJ7VIH8_LATCA|nr:sialic acid-binding Ig-like lectin 14 isoform X2 [Lates calcarifer]